MDYLQIARETLSVEEKALGQLNQKLDRTFADVVELILACEGRLVIGGIGKSGLVGKKMVATFASTGTPSFFLHPTEAFHGDLCGDAHFLQRRNRRCQQTHSKPKKLR